MGGPPQGVARGHVAPAHPLSDRSVSLGLATRPRQQHPGPLPPRLRRTLTFDNGKEFADHERIAGVAKKKSGFLDTSLGGYLVLSAMAGIYLGFGIALIFSLGAPLRWTH